MIHFAASCWSSQPLNCIVALLHGKGALERWWMRWSGSDLYTDQSSVFLVPWGVVSAAVWQMTSCCRDPARRRQLMLLLLLMVLWRWRCPTRHQRNRRVKDWYSRHTVTNTRNNTQTTLHGAVSFLLPQNQPENYFSASNVKEFYSLQCKL